MRFKDHLNENKKEKLYGVDVIYDSRDIVTRESDPDERWDNDDTVTTWDIKGLKKVKRFGDINLNWEPIKGEIYYLLYVIYSTGNSFGHNEDGSIEFITIYSDGKLAHKMERYIEANSQKNKLLIEPQSGKIYTFSAPWIGHFENFSSVNVESFVMK